MPTGIAIIGCGIIGSAVADILLHEGPHLRQRSGQALQLRHVVERDMPKAKAAGVPTRIITDKLEVALADKQTQIVVELMGGLEPARTFVLRALKAGKHVVTANKYLIAVHGKELLAAARRAKRSIAFEASTGGTIPIILAMTKGLLANDISRVVGIVNGTCNYILTQMTQFDQSYAEALAGAQAAGFAEADPSFDVNGTDSSHKIAILAALAFGADIPLDKLEVSGIDTLHDTDLRFAREMGYVCKLLAIAEKVPAGGKSQQISGTSQQSISLRVHPTFVAKDRLIANVNGSFNAISVTGHASGETLYYGRGAGGKPTASAVVADVIDIAIGTYPMLFAQLPALNKRAEVRFIPSSDIISRNYLRITALDVPGVMADITRILGQHGISISAITQHESKAGHPVPVVVMTHEARDGSVASAIGAIDKLKTITAETARIRVLS
jgi:homoserine dehydrogenase